MKPQHFWGTEKKVLIIDIDGTICSESYLPPWGEKPNYLKAQPFKDQIKALRELHKKYFLVFWTARYEADKADTEKWFKRFKVPYDRIIFSKKPYDHFIDLNSCRTPKQLLSELEQEDEKSSD